MAHSEGVTMNVILVIIGFIILVTGQQLPWVFAGSIGIILGYLLGLTSYFNLSGTQLVFFAFGVGVIFGLLVVFFRRIMLILAGFFSGAYVCYYLPGALVWNTDWISVPVVIIAGLVFAALVLIWNALPVIVASSLLGGTIVIQYIQFEKISEVLVFTIFVLFGITAQWVLMQYSRSDSE